MFSLISVDIAFTAETHALKDIAMQSVKLAKAKCHFNSTSSLIKTILVYVFSPKIARGIEKQ